MSLVDRVLSKLTGLKVRDVELSLARAVVAASDENCTLEKEGRLIALYGVFLGENPHSLFGKLNNFEFFLGNTGNKE